MEPVFKPEPEVTENEIRVRVKDPKLFVQDSFRRITISKSKGIFAIIGKLKTDPRGSTKVQAYRFDKKKWTVAEAVAWVKENKPKSVTELLFLYKETELSSSADDMITKYNRIKITNVDENTKTIKAIVSNEDKDRDNEVILATAWKKHIKSFMKHPVLLSSHKYREGLTSQIGEATNIEIRDNEIEMDFKYYADEGNKEADWGWFLAKNKRAMFSVGFIPVKSIFPGSSNDDGVTDSVKEQLKKNPRRIYTEVELLEVSQVVVGSNRGALQMGIDNPNIEQCSYMFDVVKAFGKDIPDLDNYEVKKDEPKKDTEKETIKEDSTIIAPVQIKNMAELNEIMNIWKSGRIISSKNRTIIKSTIELLGKSMVALKQLLEISEPKQDGGDDEKSLREVNELLARNKTLLEQ